MEEQGIDVCRFSKLPLWDVWGLFSGQKGFIDLGKSIHYSTMWPKLFGDISVLLI